MDENNFYDEMMDEKDVKEKKNITPFLIIFFIIIILGLALFVTYLKLTDKKEEKEEEIIKPVEEIQTIELTCDEACDYKVLIDNEEIPISYTVSKSIDDEYTHKVTIHNNTVIDKTFACGGPAILKVLKDTILISYHDGCDIGGNTLHAYNKDGLELFSYEYLDPTLNMWMENTDFEVEDNKIKVGATRVYHGPTLRLSNLQEVNLCSKEEWSTYNIDENTISSGIYEIEYLGNSQFKQPVLISKESVKEYTKNCETNE